MVDAEGVVEKNPEGWNSLKKILVILAHPDDPEFFCGATIARWALAGHEISYVLFTRGDKGVNGNAVDPVVLGEQREYEQRSAAHVLGVKNVEFLDYPDGYLVANLDSRRKVVSILRRYQPDVVVTSDPTNFFTRNMRINHPDHRIAGQIVSEAVFPACGNPMFFPELLLSGLEPHSVSEVWFTLTNEGNITLEITDTFSRKLMALHQHRSQIDDYSALDQRMRDRNRAEINSENPIYIESFRRIVF